MPRRVLCVPIEIEAATAALRQHIEPFTLKWNGLCLWCTAATVHTDDDDDDDFPNLSFFIFLVASTVAMMTAPIEIKF